MRVMPRRALAAAAVLLVIAAGGAAFLLSGTYNVAADAPHTRPVYALLETLRDRSIAAHSGGIAVPGDLTQPSRIRSGAGLYGEMCQSCHLAPGVAPTELSQGLYPQAPGLAAKSDLTPTEQFWIIKHGVKLSAMPAWGKTHSDKLIWDMVAFLRTMPTLTPAEYQALNKVAPEQHDAAMHDSHGDHDH
ncbi:cytochrome c [Sphingomonas donggukensis]|uniref:Cytochrome c n=1 Tax=Sphingomonas donggukensis TaxID=2949093 RepID=A0ABY4TR39_9SPHN|nr:cytochrome c [Sphingomonas donggukensis]URW74852.1 cytochrome c [Sphingomonas donggukensis]